MFTFTQMMQIPWEHTLLTWNQSSHLTWNQSSCLTWNQSIAINNTGRHFFIVIHIQEKGEKALDGAVKIINFIQSQFLSISLFNIVVKKYV